MTLVAIETSCDETAVAVMDGRLGQISIRSNLVSSQVKLHALYGGVVPELASREHLKNLPIIFEEALKQAGLSIDQISQIAVTRGPGLHGCLLMGISFAKAISVAKCIPLLGINHLEGHIFSAFLDNQKVEFPFLALLVSGGHTEIILVKDFGSYTRVCATIDDAAGEAFDKAANLLGFDYPGGAALAAAADKFRSSAAKAELFRLPKVMQDKADFSFSGLKTSIATKLSKLDQNTIKQNLEQCSYIIEQAIVESIIAKLEQTLETEDIKSIVLAGGVAANKYLRLRVGQVAGTLTLHIPKQEFCIDNAAMIGLVASERFARGLTNNQELAALSRWPLEACKDEHEKK